MRAGSKAALAGCAIIALGSMSGCRSASPRATLAAARVETSPLDNAGDNGRLPIVQPSSVSAADFAAESLAALPPCDGREAAPIEPVAFVEAPSEEVAPPDSAPQAPAVLEVEALVAEVLAVNPDLRAAAAAWRAAAQRYPQARALDDPMLGFMLGPDSWGSDEVDDAYTLEASQKFPWPGKRRLRGNIARAEANAAYYTVGEQHLEVAQETRLAYYDYFLAHRRLAVLAESTRLVEDFRQIAKTRYEAATVEQQDILLADVELAELNRRLLALTRQEQVSRARINTLLLVDPDAPLPPPPANLPTADSLPTGDELRSLALAQRPELAAQAARIRAERYSVDLAYKEFNPDVEVVARYDAFWQEDPLRPMVGMNLNLPLNKQKRWAAVCEARARLAQQQAKLDSKVNELMFAVEKSYREVEESRKSLMVYQSSLLPTAQHSVDAARASYVAGRLDFLRLVESQRQLLDIRDRYYVVTAEFQRRLAELERLIGL